MNFVTCAAKLGGAMKRFEKGLFVVRRLRLYQLPINPLQDAALAVCKGIVQRLFNREVSIAARTVDVGDRMANGTGNPSVRRGILDVVEVGIVELAGEKGDRIVATCTKPRPFDVSFTLQ